MKKITKLMLGIFAFPGIYLAVVGVWASLSVSSLLPEQNTEGEKVLLTQEQVDILLKIEDPTFYDHAGIDLSSGQGLTTITSALARDIFLSGKTLTGLSGAFQRFYRTVFDCCKRVDFGRDVMAVVLNKHLTKNQQLQLFITSVYMGHYSGKGVIGLLAAAQVYFHKDISALSNDEFIALVAMIKMPNYYHPVKNKEQLDSRVATVKNILAGGCKPDGWFDTEYKHCNGNL
ncbi:MAG TPA: biosynthetic peptidoglycan transglycosylase [Cellvibrio sp.]|nr:biosynthetic peptidoglycan transglycosylase [Cellvibrio sp.]